MELRLTHSIEYTTRGLVPVKVVAESLLANERLIYESLRLLEGVNKNLQIDSIDVSVARLSNASPLKEILAVTIFLKYQEQLEKSVTSFMEPLIGHGEYNSILTVLVFIIALCLVDALVQRLMPGKSTKAIKAEYEEKKAIAARLLNISPDILDRVINRIYSEEKRSSLKEHVIKFFAPAKIEPDTAILANNSNFQISPEAIKEVPDAIDFAKLQRLRTYDLENVVVEIHRADRDENKHGWRAVIQDVSDKKVRTELDNSIRPKTLYGETRLHANVTVIEELNKDGEFEVKAYHLREVI